MIKYCMVFNTPPRPLVCKGRKIRGQETGNIYIRPEFGYNTTVADYSLIWRWQNPLRQVQVIPVNESLLLCEGNDLSLEQQ